MSVLSDEVRPPQWIERSPAILWTASFQDELWAHAVKEQNDRSGGGKSEARTSPFDNLSSKNPLHLLSFLYSYWGPNGVSSTMGLS